MTNSSSGGKALPPRRFRPTFIATLFVVPLFFGMIALGTWQLFRLEWKEEQIVLRQERAFAPSVDFVESYPGAVADPLAEEFKAVRITGSYRHDREFYLGARALDRRIGFLVVTPFELTDGRTILVNRGWVPGDQKDPATRVEAQLSGQLTEEALMRVDGWRGYDFVRPEHDIEENFWFYVDTEVMGTLAGIPNLVQKVYVDARRQDLPGGYPLGGQTRIELVNNHLEYVITWYALAGVLAVIYVLFHYRRDGDGEDDL